MGLLSIPLEVLAVIIEHVVLDVRLPPALIDDERRQSSTSVYTDLLRKTEIHVEPKPMANSAALLSCCQYLATQTCAVVDRLYASKRCAFKLDVLIIGERQFWTTWLCLPFVPGPQHALQLEISTRIADGHQELLCPNMPGRQFASALQNWYTIRPLDLTFMYLLAAVLCRSAALDLQDGEQQLTSKDGMALRDRYTLVDHLHIDISTCENVAVAEERQHEDWLAARPKFLNSPVPHPNSFNTGNLDLLSLAMRPEWLADMLKQAFSDNILSDRAYRQLLCDRVGDVSILVDGVIHSKLDRGQRFADMKPQASPLDGRRTESGFSVGSADPFIRPESSLSHQNAPPNRQPKSGFTSRILRILTSRLH